MKHGLACLLSAIAMLALTISIAIAGPPDHPIRVGILIADPEHNPGDQALVEALRELGYAAGRNVIFKYKSAEGRPELFAPLAKEIIDSGVDVLVTPANGPTMAAAKATQTIPIVMIGATDVVETGLVASLARPGKNITGLAINAAEIAAKRVQLLQEAVPRLSRIAVLWNASIRSMALGFQNIEQASPKLGIALQSVRVSGSDEFGQAFAAVEDGHPDGLIVLFGPLRGDDLPRIVDFVVRHKIPTIFEVGRGISGGGLMEFGPNLEPMFRRAAVYIDKIANGADPATLPVEEPTQFELAINLKAAKAMGIEIPQSLLLRADRVVE
jgi:putative ABC transport system substrate-binding protein